MKELFNLEPISNSISKFQNHFRFTSLTDILFDNHLVQHLSAKSMIDNNDFEIIFINLQEFPFFTITKTPPGFVFHLGGIVSAKSVKLLDEINNPGS